MKFIGVINEKNGYYNFTPFYEIEENGSLKELYEYDLRNMLPDSEILNINLFYTYNDKSIVEKWLYDNSLFIIEFELSELEDNYSNGSLNPTAYKLSAREIIDNEKIKYIDEEGYYYVISSSNIKNDLSKTERIEINDDYVEEYQKVVFEYEKGFFAGPFEVKLREIDNQYVINTKVKENNYILTGFDEENCEEYRIKNNYYDRTSKIRVVYVKEENNKKAIELIDDVKLMNIFINSLNDMITIDGMLDVSDIGKLLNTFETSQIQGNTIPYEIRQNRLRRINSILNDELENDDAFKSMAEIVSDHMIALLSKYKNTEQVKELISEIVNSAPELLDGIKETRQAKENLLKLKIEEEKLHENIDKLKEEKEFIESESSTVISEKIPDDYNEIKKQLNEYRKHLELVKVKEDLEKDIEHMQWHKQQLNEGNKELETKFARNLDDYNQKMCNSAIDGFMAAKIAEASADWQEKEINKQYSHILEEYSSLPIYDLEPDELIEYLVELIKITRPNYDKNTIINLAICFTQGFLTVLSGKPGCGKTSICNIFAEVLGMNKIMEYIDNDDINTARYIPISVERGWTSKRDLIGYYNPLTKAFDKNSKQIYDAIKLLDLEKKNNNTELPYYILLDEANLSPMEYYWADFMNICDGITDNSKINLGENNIFTIPETLHFMATINNDHTTENLSPRLIDRSWVVTLPKTKVSYTDNEIPKDRIKIISWYSMVNAFDSGDNNDYYQVLKDRYEKIIECFESVNINVSPRTTMAIMRYCAEGSKRFEEEEWSSRSPETIALDYAISQKLLPKIQGYGEGFEKWLESLKEICIEESFIQSEKIIEDIIKRGNAEMKYYQFFN